VNEPRLFDVLEIDSAFLGSVAVHDAMQFTPAPVITGDTLWAVIRAESGEQRVVRYTLRVP